MYLRRKVMNPNKYLEETKLLDYSNRRIQELITTRKWGNLDVYNKIKETYTFVKEEIKFGYNKKDLIPASKVLRDGYGQCNTKATLLMSLLRALDVPCRLHGFEVDKSFQAPIFKGVYYRKAPNTFFHAWVEALLDDKWIDLEGVIIDNEYLNQLKYLYKDTTGKFYAYCVAIPDFKNLQVDFTGKSTYVQIDAVTKDIGIFNDVDSFLERHKQRLNWFRGTIYGLIVRHLMNKNVTKLRTGKLLKK